MLWEVWTLSKTYQTRPSELLHISHDTACYFIDRAVASFGLAVEHAMDEAENRAKKNADKTRARTAELEKWLGGKGNTARRFAEPIATR